MCRNRSLQVDVLSSILFVQSPANIGMYIVIKRLQLFPQSLEVLLKSGSFIERAPESPVISMTCTQHQQLSIILVNQEGSSRLTYSRSITVL